MENLTINPRIHAGAEDLLKRSRSFSDKYRAYHLDYVWPSIGMLDIYGNSLKGKKKSELTVDESHLLLSISSFLGVFAANIWSGFDPSMSIELSLEPENINDTVVITASGGTLLEGSSFKVDIGNRLQEWLSGELEEFHFFEKGIARESFSTNLFSLFTIGLLSGLCPSGEGKWKTATVEEFSPFIVRLSGLLSATCASYYRSLHPIEQTGKKVELYNSGLVLLPAGYSEKPEFARATLSLCTYAEESRLSMKKLYNLCTNLAKWADPAISCAGYAVASALAPDRNPKDRADLMLLSDRFRDIAPELTGAMQLAREKLKLGKDWVELLESGQGEDASEIFSLELALGYLPFLRLKIETLFNPELSELMKPLRNTNPEGTIAAIEELNLQGYGTDDLFLLRTFIYLWMGKVEFAAQEFAHLDVNHLENSNFIRSCYFELSGRLAHLKGDLSGAVEALEKSVALTSEDHTIPHLSQLHYSLAILLRETGDVKRSISHIQESLNINPNSLKAKAAILRYQINQAIDAGNDSLFDKDAVEAAYRACPSDLQVFGLAQIANLMENNQIDD